MSYWSQFEMATCYPEKCQCEMARDAFIRQPSAFWSSLAYVIAGIFIYQQFKNKTYELKLWALVCGVMGLSSLAGHGTFTRVALAFDFASIILILSFFVFLKYFKKWYYFFGYYLLLALGMYSLDKWTKISVCVVIFMFSFWEIGLRSFKDRYLQLALVTLVGSFSLFLMDEFHVACDPVSWFQWHSVWHLGTGLAMYFYGRWRFETLPYTGPLVTASAE